MILKFFKKHFISYLNALRGFKYLIKETNFWVEVIIFLVVLFTIILIKPSILWGILWLVLAILLISAEAFNTGIESLCDFVSNEHHSHIAIIKDLSALGVLLVAIALFISYIVGIYATLI